MSFLLNFRSIRIIRLISIIFLGFFVFSSPVSAQSCPTVDAAKVADLANRWFGLPIGNPRLEMLPTVNAASCAAGVDPYITVAIWLHETAASNYAGICQVFGQSDPNADYCKKAQDFGINKPEVETHYLPDGTITADHFMDQLNAFLGLPGYYASICGCADMFSFFAKYRTGSSCTPTCGDMAYLGDIKRIYAWLGGSLADFPEYPNPSMASACGQTVDWQSCENQQLNYNLTIPPLRPFPDKPQDTDKLTTFCVMRPLPVGQNKIDMRVPQAGAPIVDVLTVGNLKQDFREFITPLLSITNPKKPDFNLPFNEKAQRYLLDFLEGRAYYETKPEPANPTVEESWDLFNRLGVFRKLAPAEYQNELKRAMIFREEKIFGAGGNPYGFEPASATVHDYTVAVWERQKVTLHDYFVNKAWAPLPKDFGPKNQQAYAITYNNWVTRDNGKWYSLWPYVPMFTREDTKGIIEIQDSNPGNILPEPYSPTGKWVEENATAEDEVEVSHPHLARAYEVSTSLSYLLTPQQVHDNAPVPELNKSWLSSQWGNNSTWLDPSYKRPPYDKYGIELGAHCDVNQNVINLISSSGDFALDDQFTTKVKRVDIGLTHDMINGEESVKGSARPEDKKNCGAQYDCETCDEDSYWDPFLKKEIVTYSLNDVGCFYYKQIRSNPNYLISYTPFLDEILTSLSGGQRGLFDLFKPAGLPKQPYEEFDWPGVGNFGEESPKYDYTPTGGYKSKTTVEEKGWAEAGVRKPGDSQGYYYRYLGSIQCAKERVLQVLQPFISGSPYEPFAYSCFPEVSPPPNYIPKGVTPADEPDQPGGAPTPILTGLAGICPDGGEEITQQLANRMTGGTIRLLPNSTGPRKHQYRVCIKPTKIIIHWSGGWDNDSGNDATYQTLVQRDLACQLATDTDDTYLMQPFYEKEVEMSWCARPWNVYSINNEIAGGYVPRPDSPDYGKIDIRFTDRNGNPSRIGDPARPGLKVFPEKDIEIDMAVDSICEVMKQYNIPWQQISGHYDVPFSGKEDPGQEFLENVFIPRVKSQCG